MRMIRWCRLQIFLQASGPWPRVGFFSLKTEVSRVEKVDLHLFGPGGPGGPWVPEVTMMSPRHH